ncbi:porin family protein [Salegentibacter sediminis]|uniref:porin family protein n=1 Tax=Salegentibacter sediminis TaxID=1930251 RepID=UPI0009BED93C|nr:porin family protein [Salegentibacter sediminis]
MKLVRLNFFFLLFLPLMLTAQINEQEEARRIPDTVPSVIDSLYREDQFYIGLTFNLIDQKPASISQSSFSGGLHLGFIRDFPLNKQRNIAIGTGLGWSLNSFGHNLFVGQAENGETIFRSLDKSLDYDTNRFTTQLIEAPVEFRWRTSSAESYKFWRVYTGLKFGYIYKFKSNFVQPGNQVVQYDLPELNRFRLGANLTFGYNTFNFHFYYSLNPLFKDSFVDDSEIGMHLVRIGLMFYIL